MVGNGGLCREEGRVLVEAAGRGFCSLGAHSAWPPFSKKPEMYPPGVLAQGCRSCHPENKNHDQYGKLIENRIVAHQKIPLLL